jgi:FkbM family methyltransferase
MIARLVGYSAAIAVGLAIRTYLFPYLSTTGWAVFTKVRREGDACTWSRTISFYNGLQELAQVYRRVQPEVEIAERDSTHSLVKIHTQHGRDLWAPASLTDYALLLAEQDWMQRSNPEDHVQPGDIVLDVGARNGFFVANALQRGAVKVIAMEPEPRNIECLRRNFPEEIACGRVVIIPAAAGSVESTMPLALGNPPSQAPVIPIDSLVRDLKIARVHFVRIAEPEGNLDALRGASDVMRQGRPRVMIGGQSPAKFAAIERFLRSIHAGYYASCGPCRGSGPERKQIAPHAVYFR